LNSMFSLKGKVAVVTGAQGNLGPVWTETLLDAGASVLAIDLPGVSFSAGFRRLQTLYKESRLRSGQADVRDREALEALCVDCINSFGVPSILVNNAGIDQPPSDLRSGYRLEEIPFEVNREIFEVNTLGAFLAAQVFGSQMVKSGRGSIINIGSLYASVAPDSRFYNHIDVDPPFLKPPAYGASKAALVNLTRYLATLWGPFDVRVNTLSPGGVLGNQDENFKRKFCERVPMGRMATYEDLKGALIFLASDASSYVTGTEIVVDGGFTAW